MNSILSILASLGVLLLALNGIAIMIGGPKLAGRLNRWVVKSIRKMIAGFFIWIGNQFKP